jgi:sodium/bile acid cotransporter 7
MLHKQYDEISYQPVIIKKILKIQMNRKMHRLTYSVIVFLYLAGIALADREMPDAEKKETVYRMYAGYKKDFPNVRDMSPQQAMELLNRDKLVFVDTRKPEEMAVSMLPGAVSRQYFLDHTSHYKDKTIVAYCTISYRSGVFARDLSKDGIRVLNLRAGILAWLLEGGKVYDKNGKEVKRVHVYGDKWDYAPAGYESVKFSLRERLF